MVHAMGAGGCSAVIPARAEMRQAKRVAASLPAGKALLAGETPGAADCGFRPGEFAPSLYPEICRGKTLV